MIRIQVAIPSRGHLWCETAQAYADLLRHDDGEHQISGHIVTGKVSVVRTRNRILDLAADTDPDVLLCFDDDVVPPVPDILRLCDDAHSHQELVVSPCPIARPHTIITGNAYHHTDGTYTPNHDVFLKPEGLHPVDAAGHGCVAIPRRILKHGLRYQEHTSEDVDYCTQLTQLGHRTLIHTGLWSEHLLLLHGGGLAWSYGLLSKQ